MAAAAGEVLVAEEKAMQEGLRMKLPWELGAEAKQLQLSFLPPLLFCFPPLQCLDLRLSYALSQLRSELRQ